ncbi:c-type cytochrome biogenesis protein CcmF [Bacterioplanes sanyensis]|uniref:heme lyase CcmF/NrfE family subunit n=2 Tax=Bacterioplanes sanyensis TaxID=1249553 RepID=UPI0019A72D30|nr:heme lyase CcmF/NrfE family subunit [Bacterioplanes sanyensis]GGY33309.1 c-type cytochrome biogenesis protein CcmF [Bacterioplanes sanyensis]
MNAEVAMMVPEFGQLALIIALVLAAMQVVIPLVGVQSGREWLMAYARPLAAGQAVFLMVSLLALTYAFVTDDFSVVYVATNSNTQLPTPYKISAVWGAHEGSLLLWVTMLGAWGLAVAWFSRTLPLDMVARVLSIMGMVSVGFILFTVHTSNPFERHLPSAPLEGADLNPLLQDFGLIVHPPTLYMGYVGLSVAFAFALAALMSGRLDAAWARWSRPWTTAAWVFLTLGIALGSWWAYYELGWGGWWFWDPVENASLMPWLVATALMHSLAVTEKRGLFKSWTVLLAIFAFSLSLLGTFLVRSGVLTSVHAFASDPDRGVFILALLGICVGGSLLLYAIKAPTVASVGRYQWVSRESALLVNNLLLLVSAFAILLGTLYPLVHDFMGLGKLSVGAAWFNTMFVPLSVLLALVMGIGSMSRWKSDAFSRLGQELKWACLAAILLGAAVPLLASGEWNWQVVMGMSVSFWLIGATLVDVWKKSRGQLARIPKLGVSFHGMVLAHVGVAISIIGVTMVSNYSLEKAVKIAPGESTELGSYRFEFAEAGHIEGPNYVSDATRFKVWRDDKLMEVLTAEKRRYNASGQIMTEAAIDVSLFRDVYVSMGEELPDGAWGMRLQVKPYMRWVWLGAIFMSIGGLLAVMDKRYRARQHKRAAAPAAKEAVA